MLEYSLAILVLLLIVLQVLCAGPILERVLQFLLRRLFYRDVSLGFRGPGLILPLLRFQARDFRLMFHGEIAHDRVYLGIKRLTFRVDPFFLLIGRLRITRLDLVEPYLEYVNRMESHRKNAFLPRRHRVEFKNARIQNGRLFIRDDTMTPTYRLEMRDIDVENMDVDIATSVDFLFRTERGEALLAGGRIEIGTRRDEGYIRLRDVSLPGIASMDNIPFVDGRISLTVAHTGGSSGRHVQGVLGPSAGLHDSFRDPHEEGVFTFEFDIDWNDYRITLDLGIQKLIERLLINARAGWLGQGIVLGSRGVFEMLKKPEA